MARQLDILALEPFFGGVRRATLETLIRHSRHRWTLLKLPPRRIERRLAAAANWFSEQLTRHWVGRMDLLFTSEAMNLASLLRLVPQLADCPTIVYFHDNQLPDLSDAATESSPLDQVNLNTAQAANEIWFNSTFHKQLFYGLAATVVDRYPELSTHNPLPELRTKTRLMAPPIDTGIVNDLRAAEEIARQPQTIFLETRDADLILLNEVLDRLLTMEVPLKLMTVGPVDAIDGRIDRTTISEYDEAGQIRAMLQSSVVLSAKPAAPSDYQVIRALAAGCRPILPRQGVYKEIIPEKLHTSCLYTLDAEDLTDRLALALGPAATPWRSSDVKSTFRDYDPVHQSRAIDDRIEQIVNDRAIA